VVSITPLPLYPRERASGTHWMGGWVGPTAVMDAVESIGKSKEKYKSISIIIKPVGI